MRKILVILLVTLSLTARGTIYYCSPTGTDGAYPTRGTFASPWKSWNYAMNHVTSGDTVYFRGGVYTDYYGTRQGVSLRDTSINGTFDEWTLFAAYPADFAEGNYPILDCSTLYTSNSYNVGVDISRVSYIHFKGLTVRNVPQTYPYVYGAGYGFYVWAENYTTNPYRPGTIKFENCVAYYVAGDGFKTHAVDTAYFINCDAFACVDSLTTDADIGGQGTGFNVGSGINLNNNADNSYFYLNGCRGWNNSDQNFTGPGRGRMIMENCWSIAAGNTSWDLGEGVYTDNKGSGIKLWYEALSGDFDEKINTLDKTQLIIRNCIFAYSAHSGINWTHHGSTTTGHPVVRSHIYNNFIYASVYDPGYFGDAWGYGIMDGGYADTTRQWDHRYWNNISYKNNTSWRDALLGLRAVDRDATYNNFDIVGTPITDSWFISLDTTGMMGIHTRKADWSLPDTDFGKPTPISPLVDAGEDVSSYSTMEESEPLSYFGVAPDVGWYEYSPGPQIIADHSVVEFYDDIPQFYIDSVKKMWLSYAGESHSLGIRTGLLLLEAADPTYAVSVVESGTPQSYTDANLRASRATWGDWDTPTGWIYNYGEEDWYTSAAAIAQTKAGLDYYNDTGPEMSAFGFGWCWDHVSWSPVANADPVYGVHWTGDSQNGPEGDLSWGLDADDYALTANTVNMDTYLNATKEYIDYCEANEYKTKVFFTTPPVDGFTTGELRWEKQVKTDYIRNFVLADSTRILFDYADILCFDDNGDSTSGTWNGHNYNSITPTNLTPTVEDYHISEVGAVRLAKAMWWMLARMAGWDGNVTVYSEGEEPQIDSTLTDILTFTLADQTGAATISTINHTISIEVDYTADVTDLTPSISMDYGATIDPLSGVSQNFTSPVVYTVTALDGTTTQEWTVTVTQEEEPAPTGHGFTVKYRGKIVKR